MRRAAIRVLVTGASGFIGGHLLRHLVKAGYEVTALLRQPLNNNVEDLVSRVYPYTGETRDVFTAVQHAQPHVTFHLASHFAASHSAEELQPLIDANVLLGTQLLDAIAQYSDAKVFINTSTSWQFYHSNRYRPVNLYAATKQAFEAILTYYADAQNVSCATLYLFDSYGPQDSRQKLVPALLDAVRARRPLNMSGGEQIVDLAHVDDICNAFLGVARGLLTGSIPSHSAFAISGGQRRSLRDVVATFERAAGLSLEVQWGARPYREREVMRLWDGPPPPDWSPKISLADGFRKLLSEEVG